MQALILDAEARTANLQDIPQPFPQQNEILVKVEAIGLNPIDSLYVAEPLAKSGRTIGSDFAGTVSSLGETVPTSSGLQIGTRVAGFLQGACSRNDRPGAFAEYLVVPWNLVFVVPDRVSIEEASAVSLVALTAAQGIYYRLGLKAPFPYDKKGVLAENPEWVEHQMRSDPEPLNVFIYGASTAVGLYAAQFVRLSDKASGKKINLFGAASKARWDMLKQPPYSYDHLVDYRDQEWPEEIVKMSNGDNMHYVFDCISEGSSVERAASTLASNGQIAILRNRTKGAWTAKYLPVEPIYGAVWEGLGEDVEYDFFIPRSPAARAFAVEFYIWVSSALGTELAPVSIRAMPGGLEKVVDDGFVLLGSGNMEDRQHSRTEEYMEPISAEKMVYRI
jgi:NADPH:quinone reductase-like Zn-dependent oxidoreductase